MKRRQKILIWLIVSVMLVMWIVHQFGVISSRSDYNPTLSLTAPNEYNSLFESGSKAKLILNESYLIRGRMPISIYFYDNKYSILVYELGQNIPGSIKRVVKVETGNSAESIGPVYTKFKNIGFSFSYVSDSVAPMENIFLTLRGDSILRMALNDSIIIYNLRMNNFSIRYGENSVRDILVERLDLFGNNVPIKIVFKKQDTHLFLILIDGMSENDEVPDNIVHVLLKS